MLEDGGVGVIFQLADERGTSESRMLETSDQAELGRSRPESPTTT
jgi:hypothetical protein